MVPLCAGMLRTTTRRPDWKVRSWERWQCCEHVVCFFSFWGVGWVGWGSSFGPMFLVEAFYRSVWQIYGSNQKRVSICVGAHFVQDGFHFPPPFYETRQKYCPFFLFPAQAIWGSRSQLGTGSRTRQMPDSSVSHWAE